MSIFEVDEWSETGNNILAHETLEAIRLTLEETPIILEHWFYRGARSPERFVFEDFEDLLSYLKLNGRPGDAFYLWDYAAVCRRENILMNGKYPDDKGRVPKKGAY